MCRQKKKETGDAKKKLEPFTRHLEPEWLLDTARASTCSRSSGVLARMMMIKRERPPVQVPQEPHIQESHQRNRKIKIT